MTETAATVLSALSASEPQASPAEGTGDCAPAGCDASARASLVHFNDTCCASAAELRSIILRARRLADDHAEQGRAAAAAKTWLLAQIQKKRAAPPTDVMETAPNRPFPSERLAL